MTGQRFLNRFGTGRLTARRVDGRYGRTIEPGGGLASDGVCRRIGDTGKGEGRREKRREKGLLVGSSRSTRAVQAPTDVLGTSKSKEQEERCADELSRQQGRRVSVSVTGAKQRRTHFAQRCDQVTLDHKTSAAELAQRYDHLLGHGDEPRSDVSEARSKVRQGSSNLSAFSRSRFP